MPSIRVTKLVSYDIPLNSSVVVLRRPVQDFDLSVSELESLAPILNAWQSKGALSWTTITGPDDVPSNSYVSLEDVIGGDQFGFALVKSVPYSGMSHVVFGPEQPISFPVMVLYADFEVITPFSGGTIYVRRTPDDSAVTPTYSTDRPGPLARRGIGSRPLVELGQGLEIVQNNTVSTGILNIFAMRIL